MTAKIKLNAASGGGSFSLQAPSSSANNRVFTIPDVADGTIATTATAGKILQVVQNQTTTFASNETTTMADTNLSATITPTSTSSKILVYIVQSTQIVMATNIGGGFQLLRGSTVIHQAAPVSNGPIPVQLYFGNFASNANFYFYHNMHKLDSPSTTSATTYKTQMALAIAGSSRSIRAQPTGDVTNGISTITLFEVAA